MPKDLPLPVTHVSSTATSSGIWSKREEELFTQVNRDCYELFCADPLISGIQDSGFGEANLRLDKRML